MPGFKSVFRAGLFDGHVVLVSGGGTGIGRMIAHELASLGATVVIASRKEKNLKNVQKEIMDLGGRCDYVVLDIRKIESCHEAVKTVLERHGRLDGLVNNSGGQFPSPADQISPGGFRTVVELNLFGTWNLTRAAYDLYMKQNGGGCSIVNITMANQQGMYLMAHSGAARAGVVNLTKTLAIEWTRESGVRINCVAPASSYITGTKFYVTGGAQLFPGGTEGSTRVFPHEQSKVPAYVGFEIDPDTLDAPEIFKKIYRNVVQIGKEKKGSKI